MKIFYQFRGATHKRWYNKWFKNGLHFSCTQCGKCCTKAGIVRITKENIKEISNFLKISQGKFIEKLIERGI